MFLFMMNDTTTKTAANAMRLMTEAMEAWSAVAAHNATLGPSVLRTMNANGPLTPPETGFDANWAAEAATLYVHAHRSSWRAALEGWKSVNALKDVELAPTPFGLTGVFASTAPEAAPAPRAAAKTAKAAPRADRAETQTRAEAEPKPQTAATTTPTSEAAPATTTAAPDDTGASAPTAAALDTLLKAPRGEADDLTRIKGIGPKLCGALHDLGIFHFWQIARLSEREIAWINDRLRFKGRIERERWVEQAKVLAGDTASA